MKSFFSNLLLGISLIKFLPDERSVEEILEDYKNQNQKASFMVLGFLLILMGRSGVDQLL
jgi:hypothetical protein